MSMALFPSDAAKRLVLLSDGNENVGQLLDEADWYAANHVPIDVLPARYERGDEVVFEQLITPAIAHVDDTINLQMVLRTRQQSGQPVRGRLQLYHNDRLVPLGGDAGGEITLEPGLERIQVPVPLKAAGAHRFRAVFQPSDPDADMLIANNTGEAFTIVSGQSRILIVTTAVNAKSAEILADALRSENLECEVQVLENDERPLDALRLLDYSLVILSNVPANQIVEAEQDALSSYVRDSGGGLVMVGGDESFGAGGWMGSTVEEVMPVSFDVKSKKQIPKGALVLVMHACEIPQGNYWGERVAVAAVKTLSRFDLAGVLSYQWDANKGFWVAPLQQVGDKRRIIQQILNMQMGDMPDLDQVMRPGVEQLIARRDAAARHMIVISDFDPRAPQPDLLKLMKEHKISASTVAIGYGGHPIDETKARNIANTTGGKFYRTNNFSELPQIFIKESRIVRRALINENPFRPILKSTLSEVVTGLAGDALPQLGGYVVTTIKPLAQMPLIRRTSESEDPLLAYWQVGLGRTVAFTSGMWDRWGPEWASWPKFSKLWSQIVRWAARQSEEARFDVSTSFKDGKGKIRITALDQEASAVDFLNIHGNLVKPNYESEPVRLIQTGPGEYEAEFDARLPGNYIINAIYTDSSGGEQPVVRQLQTGLSVPYSPEYREMKPNMPLLTELAERTGGRVLTPEQATSVFDRGSLPRAETRRTIWEDLVRLMLLLFLIDVAVRRIAISPVDVYRRARKWLSEKAGSGGPVAASEAALSALKATRERVRDGMQTPEQAPTEAGVAPDRSARYEPPTTEQKATDDLNKALGGASETDAPVVSRPTRKQTPTTETDYTSRLLRAKRRARGQDGDSSDKGDSSSS
jgi:uncharacterized membrane protein